MAKTYVLFNPLSGNGKGKALAVKLQQTVCNPVYLDLTEISDYAEFFQTLESEDSVILCGGDGTLNRFANDTCQMNISREILYYPTGTGNDFAFELGIKPEDGPMPIGKYLKNLPTVRVNDRTYRFINGVGYGIDGYCCEEGDRLRAIPDQKINYTAIAIQGLLFRFDARNAKVVVDGKSYSFNKVWIAPTMHGKCYGGGMIAAPNQDRLSQEGTVSLMLFHGAGRLRTLMAFPSIFKGEHIKYEKMVTVLTGHQISVEFDRPTPLQIDGETVSNVTAYQVASGHYANREAQLV